ncbi:hypothetical protein HETIRDRAFT_455025 [Heterobasidion irregulare TC 32-1]|uniref:Uncharacterized protein n=1 Tax=Heterobasidion irregulare (strain TC 32-1) TaxID=747525 RepID=W4JTM1_HETIT|nr:uncharacterized protein HETIRDRAFT_455025 [Heterobasidion irregulare TC 32-1]ETW76455.1 hypothetical protein HETIRDRAFT_455025 [Heterobasidion irregulare TC 32-1]
MVGPNPTDDKPPKDVRQHLATSTHLFLPLDIAKATYLLPLLTTTLSTTNFIA